MGTMVHRGEAASAWSSTTGADAPSSARSRRGWSTGHQLDGQFEVGLTPLLDDAGVSRGLALMVGSRDQPQLLHRPILEALLFLAIAVGITPQLFPAVVNASCLASGSQLIARTRRCWSNDWPCIEIWATSTCWSPTRRAPSPTATSTTSGTCPPGTTARIPLRARACCAPRPTPPSGHVVGGTAALDPALWDSLRPPPTRQALEVTGTSRSAGFRRSTTTGPPRCSSGI